MGQYIPLDALVAEIERRIKCFKNERNTIVKASDNNLSLGARIAMCEELIVFINSMQVEPVISVWHNKDDMPIAGKQLFVTYDGLDAKRILTWQKDFITIAIDKWAYIDDLLKL